MGHRVKTTIFALKFEDPDLHDLEVMVRKPSMDEQLDTIKLQELTNLDQRNITSEDVERLRSAFEFFASFLVSWNLEKEDGTPIDCTAKGLLEQDDGLVLAIMSAWVGATNGVSAPLGDRSNGGGPLAVESIPMETLSANHQS